MKKLLLSALLGLGSLSLSAADGDSFVFEGLNYNILSETDKTCEVGINKDSSDPDIVIPSKATYNGVDYTVTTIGIDAFYGSHALTTLSIPETVTTIRNRAIAQTWYLMDLVLPNSVTTLERRAIYGNFGLYKVTISSGLREIGPEAFSGNPSLGEVNIPDGVEIIQDDAFNYCSTLLKINFGSTLKTVGKMAFAGCSSLPTLSVPANINELKEEAFSYCKKLATVTFEECAEPITLGINLFGQGLYAHDPDVIAKIKTLTLNRQWTCKTTNINEMPFTKKTVLNTVNIGPQVTSVPANTFSGSEAITAVNVNSAVCPTAVAASFPDKVYQNATLTVPDGAVEAYKAHPVWGKFLKIQGDGKSGIETVEVAPATVAEYYDLSGRRVEGTPAPGLYIVRRTDGSTAKVLINR